MKKILSLLIAAAMIAGIMITPAMAGVEDKTEIPATAGTFTGGPTANGVWMSTDSSTAYGGKLSGEKGICITLTGGNNSERRISFTSDYTLGKYVYSVNFLYTGSARPLMYSMSGGIDLFVVNSAGQVGYGLPNTFVDTYLEESKWYNLSVEMDKDNKVFKIYLNGVLIGEHTDNRTNMTGFDLGVLKGSKSSATDEVYYDDIMTYPGEYDASEHIIEDISGEQLGLYNDIETISYDPAVFTSVTALKEEILDKTGAQSIRICNVSGSTYTDASVLASGETVVIKKGDAYRYYTLKKMGLEISEVEFTESEGLIGADALISNISTKSENVVMIMVLKDSGGVIRSLTASDVVPVLGTDVPVTISPFDIGEYTPEIFFIDGWDSKLWLFDEIYKKD